MPFLYDNLIRLGLKPDRDFKFLKETDSLMMVREPGVRKLVAKRFWINTRGLHVSMIPNDNGIVESALVSAAEGHKRPGFWHVILDRTGRPVAEHPLTYSRHIIEPSIDTDQPPTTHQADDAPYVETTGQLARMLISWLVGYDQVNDDDSAKLLEILSLHTESPRAIKLELPNQRIAQRLYDELTCFIDDARGIDDAIEQATTLQENISSQITDFPV
jgi:hypothetical protein